MRFTSVNADGCRLCREESSPTPPFTFAFQPIVDLPNRAVVAYEALARGPDGEPADAVLGQLTAANRYAFDQEARVKAIRLAAALMAGTETRLSINFFPNAVYDPVRCLRTTLRAASEAGFASTRLMFEVTEHEQVDDAQHLSRIIDHYSACGFTVAIDDFGAGFAGLNLLADFRPHIIKLDRLLLKNVHDDVKRQAIVRGILETTRMLEIDVIAEGVETMDELEFLAGCGVSHFQGFLFAKPAFEALPEVDFSRFARVATLAYTVPPERRFAAE